jgi:PEP-CTERM motif
MGMVFPVPNGNAKPDSGGADLSQLARMIRACVVCKQWRSRAGANFPTFPRSLFMRKNFIAAAALLSLAHFSAQATLSVDSVGFTYSQNFDSLTTSTTAVPWVNNSTLPGWSLFISTLADAPTIAADTGSSNAGTFRSFGSSGSGDRALGGLASGGSYFGSPASGAVAGYIALAFTNNSGVNIDGFTLGFAGEQWRNGGNTSAQPMTLEFGLGASLGTVSSWAAPGGTFDYSSPVVGSTAAAVDGNMAGRVAGLGGSVTPLTWAPGDTLWIRWIERNDSGNDHGLAIDDLTFSITAVPEPGALALMLAGLGAVGFVARRRRV